MLGIVAILVLIHHCSLNWMHLGNKGVIAHLRNVHRLVHKLLWREVSLRLCNKWKVVKSTEVRKLLAGSSMMHLLSHMPHHATHIERVRDTHSSIEHCLNVVHLLLLAPEFLSEISDHILLLDNMCLLFVIFALELFFDLTHHLSLLKSPLLL